MKVIKLSQGQATIVDDEDFERLSQFNWCYLGGYAARTDNKSKTTIRLHRFLLDVPLGVQVDHIDGDGLNNQRNNLRLVTNTQNQYNRKLNKNNKSGYKGVSWKPSHKAWDTQLQYKGKCYHLGYFKDKKEAALAYNRGALKYFGEHARLNQFVKRKRPSF